MSFLEKANDSRNYYTLGQKLRKKVSAEEIHYCFDRLDSEDREVHLKAVMEHVGMRGFSPGDSARDIVFKLQQLPLGTREDPIVIEIKDNKASKVTMKFIEKTSKYLDAERKRKFPGIAFDFETISLQYWDWAGEEINLEVGVPGSLEGVKWIEPNLEEFERFLHSEMEAWMRDIERRFRSVNVSMDVLREYIKDYSDEIKDLK